MVYETLATIGGTVYATVVKEIGSENVYNAAKEVGKYAAYVLPFGLPKDLSEKFDFLVSKNTQTLISGFTETITPSLVMTYHDLLGITDDVNLPNALIGGGLFLMFLEGYVRFRAALDARYDDGDFALGSIVVEVPYRLAQALAEDVKSYLR